MLGSLVVEFNVCGGATESIDDSMLKPAWHHTMPVRFGQQPVDVNPFPAGPALLIVVRTEHGNDEIGLFVVKPRQTDAEVVDRKLSLVKFVVKDRTLAESLRENGGDFRDKFSLFAREGKCEAETSCLHQ